MKSSYWVGILFLILTIIVGVVLFFTKQVDRIPSEVPSPYPHPLKWALPENHGASYRKSGMEGGGVCLECHEDESNFKKLHPKDIFIACNSCHEAFPHGDLEEFIGNHTSDAGIARTYKGQCTLCHKNPGENLSKNEDTRKMADKGCYSCHGPDQGEDKEPTAEWKKVE